MQGSLPLDAVLEVEMTHLDILAMIDCLNGQVTDLHSRGYAALMAKELQCLQLDCIVKPQRYGLRVVAELLGEPTLRVE